MIHIIGCVIMDERLYNISEFAIEGKEAVKTVFQTTDSTSGSVWCVKPGQEVACHTHNNSDDIWICIQGEGVFYPELGDEIPIKKGQVAVTPKGLCHGATNTGDEDFIFVSIVAPVPADYNPL